jgi:hypothetical protein
VSRATIAWAGALPSAATLALAALAGASAFFLSEVAIDRARLVATLSTLLRRRR